MATISVWRDGNVSIRVASNGASIVLEIGGDACTYLRLFADEAASVRDALSRAIVEAATKAAQATEDRS